MEILFLILWCLFLIIDAILYLMVGKKKTKYSFLTQIAIGSGFYMFFDKNKKIDN